MRAAVCFTLICLLSTPALGDPGKLSLDTDYAAAQGMLDAFARGSVTDDELKRLEALPGIRAMIDQTHEFNPDATPLRFESSLRAVVAHQALTPEQDPFGFGRVAAHLTEVQSLMQTLQQDPGRFGTDVYRRLVPYSPAGVDLHVTVHMTLGGTSDGWAPGDRDFYLALEHFSGDYQGLVVLTSHEVYHLIQARLMPEVKSRAVPAPQRNAEDLLIETYREGSATVVGDPTQVQDGGKWIKWFSGKYASNADHLADDYMLLDTMLYRAAHDPGVDYDRLYSLGFSGGLGSAAYFVGYNMAHVIMAYQGRDALAGYLARPTRDFFADYLDLCDRHKDDRRCLRFGAEAESFMRGGGRAAQH